MKKYIRIKTWLDEMGIEYYIINDDLSVDIKDSVDLINRNLTSIPIQFRKVAGDFRCSNNQLTSLTGCPSYVGWTFNCDHNQLTSLIGGPKKVNGHFYCSNNQLTSLTGAPSKVGGNFNCSDNQLTSLTGAPSKVGGSFDCSDNYLTSLTGGPSEVSRWSSFENNYLTIDEPYSIDENNPGDRKISLIKIAKKFLDKLETSGLDSPTQLRILRSLETSKPKIYKKVGKLVDLDDWLSRLQNSEEHSDIIDL